MHKPYLWLRILHEFGWSRNSLPDPVFAIG